MKTVLFVCTGNTCRSPMAEAIARDALDHGLLGQDAHVFVASAGLQAANGVPPAAEAILTLSELGIEHDGRSKLLTAQMIRKADMVLCMTSNQQAAARALVADSPEHSAKVLLLDPDQEIADPVGMGQEAYDFLGQRLREVVPQRLKKLFAAKATKKSLS